MTERGIFSYDPRFDKRDYVALSEKKPQTEAKKKKEELDSYVKKQFETHLGERFNVLLSTTRYDIKDGKLFGQNMDTPFVDVIEKGVLYRRENGKESDFKREEAELTGFRKIDKLMSDPLTSPDTVLLSISPKGEKDSEYQHNFYDIFTLKEGDGPRYVEARRYSSSLDVNEYREALSSFKTFAEDPKAEDFLKDPIIIEGLSADSIHKSFHKNHEFMPNEEFEELLKVCTPLILSYVRTLSELPFDEERQLLTFNAILNKADLAREYLRLNKSRLITQSTERDIQILGRMAVRNVVTACGASGGFRVGSTGAFSVSEYGGGFYNSKKEWFKCPKCEYKANGPVGDSCPGCGITKEKFASEGGKTC